MVPFFENFSHFLKWHLLLATKFSPLKPPGGYEKMQKGGLIFRGLGGLPPPLKSTMSNPLNSLSKFKRGLKLIKVHIDWNSLLDIIKKTLPIAVLILGVKGSSPSS